MVRIAAAALAFTACRALKTEPSTMSESVEQPVPGDWRALGQTGKSMTDSDGLFQFGAEVAAAEAAAVRAREEAAAAVAAEGGDAQVSARVMDAEARQAEAQAAKQDREQRMLDRVVDSMGHEADAEERSVDSMEQKLRHLEGVIRHDLAATGKKTEDADVSPHWVVDPKVELEEKIERKMDAELEKEESQAAKLMVHARKQVEAAVAKEKMYMHHRSAVEHETQVRLVAEADALRKEAAESGTLSEEETLQLLDISKQDLDNITSTLAGFAKQRPDQMTAIWIEEKLDSSRSKLAIASSKMVEAIKHKVEFFKNHHHDYDDHQFLGLLSRTINETMGEIRTFEETKGYLMNKFKGWDKANGEKLTLSLAQAIQGVTGSVEFKSHLLRIDTSRLVDTQSTHEACATLTNLVSTAMTPAYLSLSHQKEKLDNISKIVPSVTGKLPTFMQERMGARAASLLNMAYVENLALKEAAMGIVQEASPVVVSRLHCTVHSASVRSGFGVVAVLAALVAWLA
ncbi:unnamed protein product [Prorocentrum cordatum]|uniref:Uncharacterized protein n=1 Tax=Prorocentrum cordatum TaxID=2364126 RepID=A0ABN9TQX4_9DINO|nr:unnamed protein product [Polarella glacialis]